MNNKTRRKMTRKRRMKDVYKWLDVTCDVIFSRSLSGVIISLFEGADEIT